MQSVFAKGQPNPELHSNVLLSCEGTNKVIAKDLFSHYYSKDIFLIFLNQAPICFVYSVFNTSNDLVLACHGHIHVLLISWKLARDGLHHPLRLQWTSVCVTAKRGRFIEGVEYGI